jgi:flagellar assembly protein FliH
MSTSPSRARPNAPVASQVHGEGIRSIEEQPFPYELITTRLAHVTRLDPFADSATGAVEKDASASIAARESHARVLGRQEGQAEAEKIFAERLTRERESVAAALVQFARDRDAYFQKIEGEVVQLALAIARKILHREAQMDPLLLAGIVRVALEEIDGATSVVLRVHPENTANWQRYLTTRLDPANHPQIVEDTSLSMDRCLLETSMGTALIGMEVQLKEIERGLMDLLAARPGGTS